MATLISRDFSSPDESRTPEKTKIDIVDLDGPKVARLTAQPGWRWSECIKPVAGTDSCEARHLGVIVSGRIHVKCDDGTEGEAGTGEVYAIEPGHDAWVVGDEPFVAYEFDTTTATTYAKST
jgi:hypothetical protein